jgi:hypothetical protein
MLLSLPRQKAAADPLLRLVVLPQLLLLQHQPCLPGCCPDCCAVSDPACAVS